jgi:hypothetical protein
MLQSLTGESEKEKRFNRDRLMNLDEDNVPLLLTKIDAGQMSAAIEAQATLTEAYISLQLQGYNTKAEITSYISDTMSQISLVASGIFSGSFPISIGNQSPTYSETMTASEALTWSQTHVAANSQLFYNNTAAALNGAYEVLKPSGGFLNTKVYQWNGSSWSVFADARRTNSVGNPASYDGQYAYVTTEHTYGDPAVTYYADKLYRSNNGLWTEVIAGDGYVSSASIIAAVNADGSTLKFSADKVNITGYLTVSDFDGSSTFINGATIMTETLYVTSLVSSPYDDINYIAMQEGFDFRNETYMDFDNSEYDSEDVNAVKYSPYNRSIQGLHALVFVGDTVLDSNGDGTTNNEPTAITGYIRNMQSYTGTVVQEGLQMMSRKAIEIKSQIAGTDGTSYVRLQNRPNTILDGLASGEKCYILQVENNGIYAYRYYNNGGSLEFASTALYT